MVIAGDQCGVLETGLTATNLRISGVVNFTGIGSFPNLTSLRIDYGDGIKKLNLSELHNLTTLQMEGVVNCEEYNLGDNPIKKFTIGDQYAYLSIPSLKIISEKVETVDVTLWHSYVRYDKVTSIDVSECPALTTLKADRGDKVTTIYLKNGQNIPNLTKNKATQIVYK